MEQMKYDWSALWRQIRGTTAGQGMAKSYSKVASTEWKSFII